MIQFLAKHPYTHVFPKGPDPQSTMTQKGLPLRIVQHAGSLVSEAEVKRGCRDVYDEVKQRWLKDIKAGLFDIVQIPPDEFQPPQKPPKRKRGKQSHHDPATQSEQNPGRSEENGTDNS